MILVTGATGCLGSLLVRNLVSKGMSVAALILPDDSAVLINDLFDSVSVRRADLTQPESLRVALEGVDTIIHCAGLVLPYENGRERMMHASVAGSKALYDLARERNIKRVLHVSSIAAIGYPDVTVNLSVPVDENYCDTQISTGFAYAEVKKEADAVAYAAFQEGLDIVLVCPAAVLAVGADLNHGWGKICNEIRRNRIVFCPPGGISFLSAEDWVNGALLALQVGKSGERYILTSGDMTYLEFIKEVSSRVKRTVFIIKIPKVWWQRIARLMQKLQKLFPFILSQREIASGILHVVCRNAYYSIHKASSQLGFYPKLPVELSFSNAVRDLCEWSTDKKPSKLHHRKWHTYRK